MTNTLRLNEKKKEKKKHQKDVVLSVGAYKKALPTSCFIKQWLVADKIEILNHPYYATELHLAKLSINVCSRFTKSTSCRPQLSDPMRYKTSQTIVSNAGQKQNLIRTVCNEHINLYKVTVAPC